jgi:drug/metabolite transporter (DMT)-like permease
MPFIDKLATLPKSTLAFLALLFAGVVIFLTFGPHERVDRVIAAVLVLASGSGAAMLPSVLGPLLRSQTPPTKIEPPKE